MAFVDIYSAVRGECNLSVVQARNYVNDALRKVYDRQLWSFQLKEDGWLTPGLIGPSGTGLSAGTITVAPFTTTITGDAVASAMWLGLTGRPLLTELQIRSPFYSLYNIISVNSDDPTAVVLTIDRPWMEPAQTNATYMLYQAYFPVPVSDFKKFFCIRDTTNAAWINFWELAQDDLSVKDPQRTVFDQPCYAVPYKIDDRVGSSSLGNLLIELWPHPLSQLPYTFNYLRRGPLLVKRDDTVPYPLTDELVRWRAIELASLFKERQRGEDVARGSGADWKFSAQAAHDEYEDELKQVRRIDRSLVELYFNRLKPNIQDQTAPFATITGQLNVGRF